MSDVGTLAAMDAFAGGARRRPARLPPPPPFVPPLPPQRHDHYYMRRKSPVPRQCANLALFTRNGTDNSHQSYHFTNRCDSLLAHRPQYPSLHIFNISMLCFMLF